MDISTLMTLIEATPGKATLNSITAKADVTQNVAIVGLLQAAKEGRIDFSLSDKGQLTFSPSRKLVRKANRVARKAAMGDAKSAVHSFLANQDEASRIGPVVKGTGLDRQLVLEALRGLREDGLAEASNETGSNFHVRWTAVAAPEAAAE